MNRVKVNSDGTPAGTQVWIDDNLLTGVTYLSFVATVDGPASVMLRLDGVALDLEGDVELEGEFADLVTADGSPEPVDVDEVLRKAATS